MADNPNISETVDIDDTVTLKEFGGDGVDYSGYFESGTLFESDSDTIEWAKKITMNLGFELIIASHKNMGKKKLLTCARGGRYKGIFRDLEATLRKNMKTKACKCPFQIIVQRLQGCSSWATISSPGIKGMHNHALAVYPEGYR